MAETAEYIMVLSTSPDPATAEKIAGELVKECLAACVQIIPGVRSFFRWQGRLDRADEQLMLIKSVPGKYNEIERKIKDLHPYDVPEIIAVPVTAGLGDYLSWIKDNTESL